MLFDTSIAKVNGQKNFDIRNAVASAYQDGLFFTIPLKSEINFLRKIVTISYCYVHLNT